VTPLMARVQKSKEASEVIFIDSTASCDATECTVTSILAASPAGAIPLAIGLHNSQTTEGYTLIFSLLKSCNSLCFGGQPVSNKSV